MPGEGEVEEDVWERGNRGYVRDFVAHALWARIGKKHRMNSHLINHCPTNEGVSEVSERANK